MNDGGSSEHLFTNLHNAHKPERKTNTNTVNIPKDIFISDSLVSFYPKLFK